VRFVFDEIALDPALRELRRNERLVKIEPQVFDLLLFLIENRDRVVSKEDVLDGVWAGRVVSESALTSRITAVRKAIGDSGTEQRLLRTFPRKGYRFVGHVVEKLAGAGRSPDLIDLRPEADEGADEDVKQPTNEERRFVTILACQLSTLDQFDDPELFRDNRTRWGTVVTDCAKHFDGVVSSDVGESIYVTFGAPSAHEDDSERAIRTAQEIRSRLQETDGGFSETSILKMAIATGHAMVTVEAGGAPNVVGEVVGRAARNLNQCGNGAIIVSDTVRNQVGKAFAFEALPKTNEDIHWRLTGELPITSRLEALRPQQTGFVGRQDEQYLLHRRWASAREGVGQVVLVVGEPGIGKSRLCRWFKRELTDPKHIVASYQCSALHQQDGLYPVRNHVAAAAGFAPEDNDDARLVKLTRALDPGVTADPDVLAIFASLLSLKHENIRSLKMPAAELKEKTFQVLLGQFKALARDRPVLVIFEDLHWSDATTLELLSRLIERVHELPVLLVLTARQEFAPPWSSENNVLELHLNRLAPAECEMMVCELASQSDLPQLTRKAIISRADGNPLFVEEITRATLESYERSGRSWHTSGLSAALPETLHSALNERLDRLIVGRQIAKLGSVVGIDFSYELMKCLCDWPEDKLNAALSELVAAQLVYQRGEAPQLNFHFKHMLVRDAAYASILKSDRAQFHKKIFDYLRTSATLIATHCKTAWA